MDHIEQPYTAEEIRTNLDAEGNITGVVLMDLETFIDNDLDGVLDLLSGALTGSPLLMQVEYTVVGVKSQDSNTLFVQVSGDPSEILAMQEDEYGDDPED